MTAHLAVVLSANPHGGGKFQYSLSVLDALIALHERGARVSVVCRDEAWRERVPATGVEVLVWGRGLVGRAIRKVLAPTPTLGPLWRAIGPSIHPVLSLLRRLAPDLAVYPGNEPFSYESAVPALAPVFDLMHRYEPAFPEVSGRIARKRDTHYRRLCAAARGLLVDSEVGRTHVVESYGADPAKVFVLPYVAPTYIAHLRGEVDAVGKFGLPADYVFYPSQLWKHKNHVGLLGALALLRDRGLVVPAVFSGARENSADEVFGAVRRFGLAGQIHDLSYVSEADVVGLYEGARAMVMPTFFGPTNIPPLEAFALGCPVVTSGIYGIPDQLGDAALYCDPRSPEDIADKVARVWQDAELRRALVERGRAHAAQWNQVHFNERFGAIVQACLNAAPAGR